MIKLNKRAGFWIKLLARLIDIVPTLAIAMVIAFLGFMNNKPSWHFPEPWMFYIWILILVTLLVIVGIVIPILTKGQTIGQWICRIKVVSKDGNLNWKLIKRETFFTWTWVFMALLVMAVINHTLINLYAKSDQTKIIYTMGEKMRIGLVSAVGSCVMFAQMLIGISGLVRKDKRGLQDVYANTNVIWVNKHIEQNIELKKDIKFVPYLVKNNSVEWIK